ncbi:MAG: diaminopimelate epimerase [Flavobacteriales bacterium]|nr:diaminopimelate epimerase [Flavobacteriales bacterium]
MKFYKYQGTGNDFIMIDGRVEKITLSASEIIQLCDRRFGIGADGIIIILKENEESDFEMDYYNADGSQSFCGNGSRCAQAFAQYLGIIKEESIFLAIDGMHEGKVLGEEYATRMGDVSEIRHIGDDYFINTGSPHYIQYVQDVDTVDVFKEGKAIRNSEAYKIEGTNVNFVSIHDDFLKVRTYERGVEGETLSCGTGITAVAISFLHRQNLNQTSVAIKTKGGNLSIQLERKGDVDFKNIWLLGPAQQVFEGVI